MPIYHLMNFNSPIASGGLFDFNATLGLVSIQFLILMLVLNLVLYNPILSVIKDRNEYIVSNLTNAAELITVINNIKEAYEKEVIQAQKGAELEINLCRKIYKEIFDFELNITKQEIGATIQDELILRLMNDKDNTLNILETEVDSISKKILNKCLTSKSEMSLI